MVPAIFYYIFSSLYSFYLPFISFVSSWKEGIHFKWQIKLKKASRVRHYQINSKIIVQFVKNIYLTNVYWTIQFKRRNRLKYNDKLVIIELPFPDFITTLCIMKTISSENDRSFVVNLEFRDNPEKWYVCFQAGNSRKTYKKRRISTCCNSSCIGQKLMK